MFNATQASTGAYTYCGQLVSNKVVLSKTGTAPKPGYVPGAAENGGYIAMSVLFDVDSCAPGTSAQDQKFDFGSMTEEDCHTYVYSNIETYCKFFTNHLFRLSRIIDRPIRFQRFNLVGL